MYSAVKQHYYGQLYPAVSDCVNTELSVGAPGFLAPGITQHLHTTVQIPYEDEWTHLQRGGTRACSRSTASKPTSHERLHCTMQLPDGKRAHLQLGDVRAPL